MNIIEYELIHSVEQVLSSWQPDVPNNLHKEQRDPSTFLTVHLQCTMLITYYLCLKCPYSNRCGFNNLMLRSSSHLGNSLFFLYRSTSNQPTRRFSWLYYLRRHFQRSQTYQTLMPSFLWIQVFHSHHPSHLYPASVRARLSWFVSKFEPF